MPDMTTIPKKAVLFGFPQRAAAFGTDEHGGRTCHVGYADCEIGAGFRGIDFSAADAFWAGLPVFPTSHRLPARSAHELDQQRRDLRCRQNIINVDVLDGAFRHPRDDRIPGGLRNRDAPGPADRGKPQRAVILPSRKNQSNGPRAISFRGRSKERIDGRSKAVLLWPAREPDDARFYQQMIIAGCDVNASRKQFVAVGGIRSWQTARTLQDGCHQMSRSSSGVNRNAYRGRQPRWQISNDPASRFQCTGGPADHDQIPAAVRKVRQAGHSYANRATAQAASASISAENGGAGIVFTGQLRVSSTGTNPAHPASDNRVRVRALLANRNHWCPPGTLISIERPPAASTAARKPR